MKSCTSIFFLLFLSFTSIFFLRNITAYSSNSISTDDLTLTLSEQVEGLGFNISNFEVLQFTPTQVVNLQKDGKYQFRCDVKFNLTIGFYVDFSQNKVWQFVNPIDYTNNNGWRYECQSNERGYGYYYASLAMAEVQNVAREGFVLNEPTDRYFYYDTLAMPLDFNYLGPRNIDRLLSFQVAINPRNLRINSDYFNSTTATMITTIQSSEMQSYTVKSVAMTDSIINSSIQDTKTYVEKCPGDSYDRASVEKTDSYSPLLTPYSHEYFMNQLGGLGFQPMNTYSVQKQAGFVAVNQINKINDSIKLNLQLKPQITENFQTFKLRASNNALVYHEDKASSLSARPQEVCDLYNLYSYDAAQITRPVSFSIENYLLETQFEINAQLWAIAQCITNDTYTLDSLNNAFWTSLLTGQENKMVKATNGQIGTNTNPNIENNTIDGYSVFTFLCIGIFTFYFLFKSKKLPQVN